MQLPRVLRLLATGFATLAATSVQASSCPAPLPLGPSPTRLIVVVPGTAQGPSNWQSFLDHMRSEPQSADAAWLVFDHGIDYTSIGSAREIGHVLASCIDEKVNAGGFGQVTLIGHSVGGMVTRYAYLDAAGAIPGRPASAYTWASKVDRILLFASVNKGVRSTTGVKWWAPAAAWMLRTFPHPHFVLEDALAGSDFIADTRIAWIRHFGELQSGWQKSAGAGPPRVVQFWGTLDSVVSEQDNADLEAFSGPVIVRVAGATHRNLHSLDEHDAADPAARWSLFQAQLFNTSPSPEPRTYAPQRVLFIVQGIRDSSNSTWVQQLHGKAARLYTDDNVIDIEYGYFSAAKFAFRPMRAENIPRFRDIYTERLAKNPLTQFDFIGHSNGTFILGQSLQSTPSMRFHNVVLAAPVLPTDYNWDRRFALGQLEALRYDTATLDWPVGILCRMLNAVGFSDVGPSSVVLFGQGSMVDSRVKKVGWYDGGHSAALRVDETKNIDNLAHLLGFAWTGTDLTPGEPTTQLGIMQQLSQATPWALLLLLCAGVLWFVRLVRAHKLNLRRVVIAGATLLVLYMVLDIV